MVNVKGLLKAGGFDLRCYHQERFDIESSTAQQNMTEPHEGPVETMQFIGEVVEYRVILKDTGKTIPCPSNTNILVAMQKQGITHYFPVRSACVALVELKCLMARLIWMRKAAY